MCIMGSIWILNDYKYKTLSFEVAYLAIKAMKEMYYAELNEIFQKISFKLQQNDSLPQQPKPEQLQKLRDFKQMLESLLQFLQLT
ncbi:Mediator of RNA polymerase II transcription subunit 15a-like protein, partial [Drosera capensis]